MDSKQAAKLSKTYYSPKGLLEGDRGYKKPSGRCEGP